MKRFLLLAIIFGLLFSMGNAAFAIQGYNGTTYNAQVLASANVVYTLDENDWDRRLLRLTRVDTDIYLAVGDSTLLTSINYSIRLDTANPVYEINQTNFTRQKVSAVCGSAGKQVIVFKGTRSN